MGNWSESGHCNAWFYYMYACARASRYPHTVYILFRRRACEKGRADMAMGVHMDKDCAPAVDAIATRFSSISSSVSARASGSSQTAGLRPWSARIRASEVVLPNANLMLHL